MKKPRISKIITILFAACILTACGVQKDTVPQVPARPEILVETPEELSNNMLPALDIAALESAMTKEDYAAFAEYLPVLRGEETFCWVAGPYRGYPDYDWKSRDVTLEEFHCELWGDNEHKTETLLLDRLAMQDIDGDGGSELVLLVQDMAYNYLILSYKDDTVYGTDLYVRWFGDLQRNGVYVGSGGAGDQTYYQMAFRNERFEQQELGHKSEWATGCECTIDGEPVTKESFDDWLEKTMVGEVIWYLPEE